MVFTATNSAPSGRGTTSCSRLRQSIFTAAWSLPKTEMNWSMMPQGIPTNWFSALRHSLANSSGSIGRPSSSARAVETSMAAEELSPEPTGTVL